MRKDREQSEEFEKKKGLRQGGTLSPILFIMIVDDVAKEIKSKIKQTHVGYKYLKSFSIAKCMFADDLVEQKWVKIYLNVMKRRAEEGKHEY